MMNEFSELQAALLPGGEPADVRKIEMELLDDGRWRWRLSTPDGPLFSAVAETSDFEAMLICTDLIVQSSSFRATVDNSGLAEEGV